MSYRLINANDLNGVISDADYEKVLNMPCVFADLPNGMDGKHYDLRSNSDEDCKWISITTRLLTDEEKELFADNEYDFTTMLNCPLPEDGDEVLISYGGTVMVDIFVKDGDGCYFEQADIEDVDAWMPLPKPYEGDKE